MKLSAHSFQFTTKFQPSIPSWELLIGNSLKIENCKLKIAADRREAA
jgi:hypothetical protein